MLKAIATFTALAISLMKMIGALLMPIC